MPNPLPERVEAFAFNTTGRVEIGPDDPLYRVLRPSRKCIEELERLDREQRLALIRVRHIVLGGSNG